MVFFIFFIFCYSIQRFFYTYRIQIEKFLPYYQYHEQIMYYLTGDEKYFIDAPMNLRFLGLWVQYLIYNAIPCVELSNIKIVFPYQI